MTDTRLVDVVAATPIHPAAFTQARLWIDRSGSVIEKVRIGMENGSVRTLTLSDFRPNPSEDPTRFVFSPPAGVQVIKRND